MVRTESVSITISEELFLALVRQNPDLRLERAADGRLIVAPPNGSDGSRQNSEILWQLEVWNKRSRGGIVFDSSGGFRLPNGATRGPDAAWLATGRWRGLSETERRGFAPLCPEFVIELLSPSDDLAETEAKVDEFVANGASLGWLIDPFRRVVEIFRPGRPRETLKSPLAVSGEGPVAGFVLELGPVFSDPALE
jgi:Uma2 family endonuclease